MTIRGQKHVPFALAKVLVHIILYTQAHTCLCMQPCICALITCISY